MLWRHKNIGSKKRTWETGLHKSFSRIFFKLDSLDLEHYNKLLYLCSFCIDESCSSLTLCSASTRSTRSLISPITAVYCDTESPFSILSGNRYGRTLVAITSLVRPSLASDIVSFKIPKWKKNRESKILYFPHCVISFTYASHDNCRFFRRYLL